MALFLQFSLFISLLAGNLGQRPVRVGLRRQPVRSLGVFPGYKNSRDIFGQLARRSAVSATQFLGY
jgi:hypothetical protein